MKKLISLIVVLSLAGCANSVQFLAGQKLLTDEAAKIADEQLVVATFSMCKAITVGAWVRAYGSNTAKAEAWRALCAAPVTETPVKP